MTKEYKLANISTSAKQLTHLLKRVLLRFNKNEYRKIFRNKLFSSLMKLLKESGFIHGVIDKNNNLKMAEERYLEAVDSIIDFNKTNELMR